MDRTDIKKGMILCAGLGTRLLPITERFPKPLVPILNVPNLIHVLRLLENAGIRDVILNLYHLPERMEEFIADHKGSLSISFSKETTLLGTGGGVKKAEPFFENQPFVLANCDFVTNAPIKEVITRHQKRQAIATMLLFKDAEREKYYSKVGVDDQSRLCLLPRLQTHAPIETGIFTGIHVLSPHIFSYLEEKPSGINEVLYPALMKTSPDRVFGDFQKNFYWFDTGEISTIHSATLKLLSTLNDRKSGLLSVINSHETEYTEKKPGVWISKDAEFPSGVVIQGPIMIGKGCIFEKNTTLGPFAVIGNNVVVGEGSKVSRSIALNGSHIAKNSTMNDVVYFEGLALPAKQRPPNQ